jgi:hypothetical protein
LFYLWQKTFLEMTNGYNIPDDDLGKAAWLEKFAFGLSEYATVLGLAAETVAQVQDDAKNYAATVQYVVAIRDYTKGVTSYRNALRNGGAKGRAVGVLAPPPPLPTFTPTLAGNVFGRIAKLVGGIKYNVKYNDAIGKGLGIVAVSSGASVDDAKPMLKAEMRNGYPTIIWKKGKMDGIKLWVDRGTGKFTLLAVDMNPDYVDKHPQPPMGQAVVWTYKGIYIKNDTQVGEWSDTAEVTVTGGIG